jgi:hypothetical protein
VWNEGYAVKSSAVLRVIGFPLLVLASIVLAPAAYAAAPTEGSGSFTVTSETVTSSHSAGGTTVETVVAHITFTGTMSGTSVTDEGVIFHPDGRFTGHAIETFSGTVLGVAGTIVFRDTFAGITATGAFQGHFTVISATGGLESLDARGTFQGTSTGTYRGRFRLDQ